MFHKIVILCSFVVLTSFSNLLAENNECISTLGKCKVSFFQEYQHIKQNIPSSVDGDSMQYDVYLSMLNESCVFFMVIAQYSNSKIENEELVLESFINGILNTKKENDLLSVELGEFNECKAVDFLVKGESRYFKGKALLKEDKLYLLATEYDLLMNNEENYKKFVDSFAFID